MVRRVVIDDEPTEETRFAIYVDRRDGTPMERIAEADGKGILLALRTLAEEKQIDPDCFVGVRDRVAGIWVIGPKKWF